MGIIAYLEKVMFGNGKSQPSPDKEEDKLPTAESSMDSDVLNVNDVWKPRISIVSIMKTYSIVLHDLFSGKISFIIKFQTDTRKCHQYSRRGLQMFTLSKNVRQF